MMVRLFIAIVAVPILILTFVVELWTGMKSAVWSAWNYAGMDLDKMKLAWRAKSLRSEDWL